MSKIRAFRRLAGLVALFVSCLAFTTPAQAKVQVHFQSFNGSVMIGRYPHTFVVFEGRLDDTGEVINENYGFSARSSSAVLGGDAEHMVMVEKPKYINSTNRHFTLTVSDDTYRRMKAQVLAWRDAPGKYYNIETRNCIHFVGEIARLGGVKIEYPKEMLRQPKRWLNHITKMNPQLGAKLIN